MEVKGVMELIPAVGQSKGTDKDRAGDKPQSAGRDGPAGAPTIEEVKTAIAETMKSQQHLDRGIRIEIEEDLNLIVVKIVDKESGEVVRQVPMPESVAAARRIREFLAKRSGGNAGLFLDLEA